MTVDTGYSNYTVEGTEMSCLLNLNPEFPKDRWYEEDASIKFAEKCNSYQFNNGFITSVDVDHECGTLENYSEDEEIKLLLWVMDNQHIKQVQILLEEGMARKDIKAYCEL